ncbi:MAG: hypothetical protein H6730_30270 [Deltaproteobacteria bacterium]|nr:hypothetical protein [Deltaproteobacteria bacterium]
MDTGETCDDGSGAGEPARCQCAVDAGVVVDAGAEVDAGAPVDAGGQAQVEGGGCGCRDGAPGAGTPALGVLLVPMVMVGRRRRERAASVR